MGRNTGDCHSMTTGFKRSSLFALAALCAAAPWAVRAQDLPSYPPPAPAQAPAQAPRPAYATRSYPVEGPYGPYSDLMPYSGQSTAGSTPFAHLPGGGGPDYAIGTEPGYVPPPPMPNYGPVPNYMPPPPTPLYSSMPMATLSEQPAPPGMSPAPSYAPPPAYSPPPAYAPSPPPAYAPPAAPAYAPSAANSAPGYAPPPGAPVYTPPPVQTAATDQNENVAAASDEDQHYGQPLLGYISMVELGVANHDDNSIFARKKEPGVDFGGEIRFLPIDWLDFMASPRPNIGFHINNKNATNQVYTGIVWEFWFFKDFFVDPAFGLSFNDNHHLAGGPPKTKQLGSNVLFREAVELGWNFYGPHSVSVLLDHISQGHILAKENEGMNTLGLQYGYRF
jgi:lipid A 3-O-deacylase